MNVNNEGKVKYKVKFTDGADVEADTLPLGSRYPLLEMLGIIWGDA